MVFYTGDPHGDVAEIVAFCQQMRLQPDDTLVILGDVGANYYLNKRDMYVKEQLNTCGPTVLCIHGNHECRPSHVPGYVLQDWNGGNSAPKRCYTSASRIHTPASRAGCSA